MYLLLLALSIVCVVFTAKRTGPFSPASFCCAFACICELFYYDISVVNANKFIISYGLSWQISNYREQTPFVLTLYSGLCLLSALSVVGLPKENAWPSIEVVQSLRNFITEWVVKRAFTALTVVLGLLTLAHAAGFVVSMEDSRWFGIIVQGAGPLGVVAMCALIYGWGQVKPGYIVTLLIVTAYFFFIMLANFSRFGNLILALGAVMLIERSRFYRGTRFSFPSLLVAAAAVWVGIFVLYGRVYRTGNIHPELVARAYHELHVTPESYRSLLFNNTQGPFLVAEGLKHGAYAYDPEYKLLSFSPFPSTIDGWKDILPRQQRINLYTPFNAWLELWYFGPVYLAGFLVFYFVLLRTLTRLYLLLGSYAGILFASPAAYAIFYLDQYPVRNSFRLMLYVFIMVSCALYYFGKLSFRVPRAQVEVVDDTPVLA